MSLQPEQKKSYRDRDESIIERKHNWTKRISIVHPSSCNGRWKAHETHNHWLFTDNKPLYLIRCLPFTMHQWANKWACKELCLAPLIQEILTIKWWYLSMNTCWKAVLTRTFSIWSKNWCCFRRTSTSLCLKVFKWIFFFCLSKIAYGTWCLKYLKYLVEFLILWITLLENFSLKEYVFLSLSFFYVMKND